MLSKHISIHRITHYGGVVTKQLCFLPHCPMHLEETSPDFPGGSEESRGVIFTSKSRCVLSYTGGCSSLSVSAPEGADCLGRAGRQSLISPSCSPPPILTGGGFLSSLGWAAGRGHEGSGNILLPQATALLNLKRQSSVLILPSRTPMPPMGMGSLSV